FRKDAMVSILSCGWLRTVALVLVSSCSGFSAERVVRLPVSEGTDLRFFHVASSYSRIPAIAQDDQGVLWFSSADGRQRYDGYTCKTYRPDPRDASSLGGVLIQSLFKDVEGKLWIGVGGGYLDRYDPVTDHFTHFGGVVGEPDDMDGDIPDVYQDRE